MARATKQEIQSKHQHQSKMKYIFDIETGPLPEAEIMQFAPEFAAPSNYTDPVKIAA